jgi:ADP-heptose:LPS heptosyltransferase/predicted O-methyltransferase YrrM/glycosyltransferase involved in cell wall biosynthesis/SAM-dependent methyltransferase
MKVAVFFAHFPIAYHTYVYNFVNRLASRVHAVDFFLYDAGDRIPVFHNNVTVINVSDAVKRPPVKPKKEYFDFVPEPTVALITLHAHEKKYDYCIGIETIGLMYADIAARISRCPFAYHSLEMYTPAIPGIWRPEEIAVLQHYECALFGQLDLFLIQDACREREFLRSLPTPVQPPPAFYFPISMPPHSLPKKPRHWHERYQLSADMEIIFYFGQINTNRFVDRMITAAQSFADNQMLILQGSTFGTDLKLLQKLDVKKKVRFAPEFVDNDAISLYVASADVGCVFYKHDKINESTAGRSSTKLALYMQSYIPVVCSDYPTFREVVDHYHNGKYIADFSELPGAVSAIAGHYSYYASGAQKAFEEVYNLDRHMDRLLALLRERQKICLNATDTAPPSAPCFGPREKKKFQLSGYAQDRRAAKRAMGEGRIAEGLDFYEQLVEAYPKHSVDLLAEVFDLFQQQPHQDRYRQYQSRHFNFGIAPTDMVLDIGSGNVPFPLATHLADISLSDDSYGRAGCPFKVLSGKKVYECNIEKLPFHDKEFDFVYCSHVLEHVDDPDKACREIMRVGKRGYIETPAPVKDFIFDTAKVSHHRWGVECDGSSLVFREYSQKQVEGPGSDLLRTMSCSPISIREKALNALIHLKADRFNTMLMWDAKFDFTIHRLNVDSSHPSPSASKRDHLPATLNSSALDMQRPVNAVSISFVIIVLNGMPLIEPCLKAVYGIAHEILVVEGAVEQCMFAAHPDGSSRDGTVEFMATFPDPQKKIRLIQGRWPEKVDMQNAALSHVTGDYVWLVDSDEIYKQEDLRKIRSLLAVDPAITQVNFIPDNFWKCFDYLFVSPSFFKPVHHYRRLFKFKPGSRFATHRPPTLIWPGMDRSTEEMKLLNGTATREMGIYPYHYSYVFDSQVEQKIELYRRYGWGEAWGINLEKWYREFYQQWTPGNRIDLERHYPIWTGDPRSYSTPFTGTHPEVMTELIENFRRAGHSLPATAKNAADVSACSEQEALVIAGALTYQKKVIEAWSHIELDSPLLLRKACLEENVAKGDPFWNLHVGLAFVANRLQPRSYLEIGVRTGAAMVQVLHNSSPQTVTGVDLWAGEYSALPNRKEFTERQLAGYQQKTGRHAPIELIQGDSHAILKKLVAQGQKYDLITVDGDHSREGAIQDLEDAFLLLNECGVIVFDDIIHASFKFLRDAIQDFARRHPELQLVLNTTQDNGTALLLRGITWSFLKGFRIAGEGIEGSDLTQIQEGSEFETSLRELVLSIKPRTIIETGTYLGRGTTRIIATALRDAGLCGTTFYSIECNPSHHQQARFNLDRAGLLPFVKPLLGVSVPRDVLPTVEKIHEDTVRNAVDDDIFVDHQEQNRVALYYGETDFPDVPENLLGACLEQFGRRCDLVLLDSAGHMGNVEFNYVIEHLRGECYLVLDDIRHIKHYKSFQQIQQDQRFTVITSSDEKFGFCIAKFTPARTQSRTKNILWVRPDSIGDNILAASMLPHIKAHYGDAHINVVCQQHVAELYERCPFVDRVVTIPTEHQWSRSGDYDAFIAQVRQLRPDILLNSTYSLHEISDLPGLEFIPERIAFRHAPKFRYTRLAASSPEWKPELERHRDFLQSLSIPTGSLSPMIWLDQSDVKFAREFFSTHHLEPQKTIALFPGARTFHRYYEPEKYAQAINEIASDDPFSFLVLGGEGDRNVTAKLTSLLTSSGHFALDMAGNTTIRQMAALLKMTRLYVGTETAAAHICCAVGTPNVVLLGGGHFGRFMPYSPLTTVACLPLECYGCNWKCRYDNVYCIKSVSPAIISEAISSALERNSEKTRIFMQGDSAWDAQPGKPAWKFFDRFLRADSIEISDGGQPTFTSKAKDDPVSFSGQSCSRRKAMSQDSTSAGIQIKQPAQSASRSKRAEDLKPPGFDGATTPAGIRMIGKTDSARLKPDHLETLQRVRNALAERWLNIPDAELARRYAGEEGRIHREMATGPIKDVALSSADRKRADALVEMAENKGGGSHLERYLLAAMLYLQPYELAGVQVITLLPEWLQEDYLRFLLELPRGFQSKGIVEVWCGHLEKVMRQILNGICRDPHAHLWQKLSFVFSEKAKLVPFYFARNDLKQIFALRASIVDFALRIRRYDLDFSLPRRPAMRGKLRLGIHCRGLAPYSEMFATLPIFKFIERSDFEVYLYVNRSDGNPFEMCVRRLSDKFTLLPDNIKESVQKIREDDLDILFFGNNLTATSGPAFLLANHRLARVQGIHFCNPVTSGQRHIDFFLLGRQVSGNDEEQGFTEKVLRIEGSGICFDLPANPENPLQAVSRAEIGVADRSLLFISGANYFKITPELCHLWARIISRVPHSVLLLYPFGPAWANEYPKKLFADELRAVFAEHGIPSSRLILVDTLSSPDAIMALNRIADVYLDAVPYSGATSLLDPLKAGLAVVVADGGELRFAQGAAMLRELGLPELVAADVEEYVHLAVRLGSDASLRQTMRERIRDRMSRTPDFLNPRLYGRRVSEALLGLFPDFCHRRRVESDSALNHRAHLSSAAI